MTRAFRPGSLAGSIGLVAAIGLVAWYFAPARPHPRREITLRTESVPLDASDPRRNALGRLRFVAGVVLRSEDETFGGVSGLRVFRDEGGLRLAGVSDSGESLSGSLDLRDGRIAVVGPLAMASLPDLKGRLVSGKRWGDSEAIAAGASGRWLVSFERKHRIWSYARDFSGVASAVETPEDLQDAPPNGGLESLASWPDGDLVALTETMETARGTIAGFLLKGGRWTSLEWTPSGQGFRPSDADTLPDGDLLVLERRWSALAPATLKARILRVPRAAIWPGAVLKGDVLAELTAPLVIDNFEGITAFEDPARPGSTQILIVSDDNFNRVQRTLLLWLELPGGAAATTAAQPAR